MLSKAQYPIAFGENMENIYFPKRYYKFIYIYPSLYVGCFSSKPQAMKMEKKKVCFFKSDNYFAGNNHLYVMIFHLVGFYG